MLSRSISRTDAAPSDQASAFSRIFLARRTRSSAVRTFESSTPRIARASGGMMTAHATTGPASGPRPTSSTPASIGPDASRNSRSIVLQRRRLRSITSALDFGLGPGHNDRATLLFANPRRLAREVAQVIELGPANTTAANDYDVADHRAMHGEDALDADTVRHLPDGKGLVHPCPPARDTHALERLEPFL